MWYDTIQTRAGESFQSSNGTTVQVGCWGCIVVLVVLVCVPTHTQPLLPTIFTS